MLPSSWMYPGKETVIDYLDATNEARHAVHFKDGQKPLVEILQHYLQGDYSHEECCDSLQQMFGTTWAIDTMPNILHVTHPSQENYG